VAPRHGHVGVVGARRVRAAEDWHDEPRVDRVEDVRDPLFAAEGGHRRGRTSIHCGRYKTVVAYQFDRVAGARLVVVGDHEVLEELAAARDARRGGAYATGAD